MVYVPTVAMGHDVVRTGPHNVRAMTIEDVVRTIVVLLQAAEIAKYILSSIVSPEVLPISQQE